MNVLNEVQIKFQALTINLSPQIEYMDVSSFSVCVHTHTVYVQTNLSHNAEHEVASDELYYWTR